MITVNTENENGVCKMQIEGEMTIYFAEELKKQMFSGLDECAGLELDLSRVTEMDTSGFQLIFLAQREFSGPEKKFQISASSYAVSSVLELFDMKAEGVN